MGKSYRQQTAGCIHPTNQPTEVSDFIANVTSFTQDPREFLGFEAQAVASVRDLGADVVNGPR
jgi:hypothetical protein